MKPRKSRKWCAMIYPYIILYCVELYALLHMVRTMCASSHDMAHMTVSCAQIVRRRVEFLNFQAKFHVALIAKCSK